MPVSPPLSSFTLELRPQAAPVIGRSSQLAALRAAMDEVAEGLRCVTLEGEPGIGKTHLLESAAESARERGFHVLTAISDEELQGPLLVAGSLFGSNAARALASRAGREEALDELLDALAGRPDATGAALPPDRQLIRTYDLAAIALASLAASAPVAVMLDDVQWADQDSIRLLRYVVRTAATSPILVVLAMRPDAGAPPEVATLIADMERLRVARRQRLERFDTADSGKLLGHVLEGKVAPSTLHAIHTQAEGVPFVLEELARAYRETGLLQRIEDVWQLAPKAERLLPHSVEMLIRRRVDRLPEATRVSLSEGAVIGRTFGLADLLSVKERLGDPPATIASLAEALAPAIAAGLLAELPEGWAADCRFAHEQIRSFAAASLPRARRREIHAAIVDLVVAGGDPPPEAMAMVAHHAIAAGMGEQCARYSVQAAHAALDRNAPDEVLRLVDESLAAASNPSNRIELLRLRDDALGALRRQRERLEMLPQLAALAEAIGDVGVGIEVTLRRAAALRLSGDEERAVELSEEARERAREAGAREAELRACLELGQAVLRSPLGEAAGATASEPELERAESAYLRAVELAGEIGDRASEAAAWRELGAISLERVRKAFSAFMATPDRPTLQQAPPREYLFSIPGLPERLGVAIERFGKALEIYEELGDQRGMMTTLIAMAYARTGPDIRFGSARRLEDLRRVVSRLHTLVRESDRERQGVQMLYGVHLYARAFGFPDLALERGRDAYRGALGIGDRDLEFLAAGGTALAHLAMGEVAEASEWLEHAAVAAAAAPSALRARHLEMWRGMVAAEAGDAAQMRERLTRALELAVDRGKAASRCEVLARLALDAALLASKDGDPELLSAAEGWASDAGQLAATLPGDHPWTAQAHAATALVLEARGDLDDARDAARAALVSLEGLGFRESDPPYPLHLDVVLAAVRVLDGSPEADEAKTLARTILQMVGERTLDEDVRVRWFRAPVQRALVELAGPVEVTPTAPDEGPLPAGLSDREAEMLRMITDGMTNHEMADALGVGEDQVVRDLAGIYAKLGVGSRAGATVFAMLEGVA